jgi:superfamily II DNA or RNA helicase
VKSVFISDKSLSRISWQAFERAVSRLLILDCFTSVRLVGQTSDKGADIIASKNGKRWLFQVKRWKSKIGSEVIDETISALSLYRAQVPVVVSLNGFEESAREHQKILLSRGTPLQLWDRRTLIQKAASLPDETFNTKSPFPHQEQAIQILVKTAIDEKRKKAMIVMATGLGKTFTAAESIRRIESNGNVKVLILAHTNELVYQLEKAFWPFLKPSHETLVWNGYEQPEYEDIHRANRIFGCVNSVSSFLEKGSDLPDFDIIIIDECHHVGGGMYNRIIENCNAGSSAGPMLIGLTATPWRPDDCDLGAYFGDPLFTMDMVTGLRLGFLSNVDYRMFTDNIDWDGLTKLKGMLLTPKQINRTLFISEWDNAVVQTLRETWREVKNPRAIVFCGTIDHAITMRDQINAMGFCNAEAIYSQTMAGQTIEAWKRNKILCDFQDGIVNAICVVDVFNEGIDVPDVNIIVFQRVTHSRRIFIQQLGRGLRVSDGKEKVVVLDFVSDIRRFAAGINLKDELEGDKPAGAKPVRVKLNHTFSFLRAGKDDKNTETFLRQWLDDVASIEAAGEDASVLKFPPVLSGSR